MSWFTDIFSSGVKDVVGEIGGIIDDLHDSGEEMAQAKERITTIMNTFAAKQMEHASRFEGEITARHAADMRSDSWLSKNIRPLTLAVTGGTIYLLVYLTVFSNLTKMQIGVLESWIPPLLGLFGTMVVFYFGSRGIEKVNQFRKDK